MRAPSLLLVTVACASQVVVLAAQVRRGDVVLKIPPVKTSVEIAGQPVTFTVWGSVSAEPANAFRLAVTADLSDFQEHLTPLLGAQLNRSDRCGERLSVERATLSPAPPSSLLVVSVHYERWGCAKAFGKELVKRLVGGNGVVEATLTPSVNANAVSLTSQVRKIDADGGLGEVLRSGSFGDSLREKIAASIQSAIQKSLNLKSALAPQIANSVTIQTVQFADGGSGHLWLDLAGDVHLSGEELRGLIDAGHHY
jgi:hypothetical protein